ncbi:E-selectin [Crotalus tigris]|uniref:E-selectin n=1 Tax=Crotalus tigris TaxID=88082 RepID=UPI00192FAE91|nr:E-selectin [Crotalus tigris]
MNTFYIFSIICYGLLLFKDSNGWTYHASEANMNYAEAEKWCKTHFTNLVAIQNKEEIHYLNATFPSNSNYYWIGIRKIENEWRWVGTNKQLTEEAKNWAEGEPNNGKKNEDCVEIYIKRTKDSGKWNDEPCYKTKRALCYNASCTPNSCSGCGDCIETINNYICHCNKGFYGRDCEHVITCDQLEDPDQGIFTCKHPIQNFGFNSSCDVQCKEGYKPTEMESITCTNSGKWSAPSPSCKVVECYAPQKPMHGLFNCSNPSGNYAWNSSCNFSCEEGFVLKGPDMLQCGASGKWDGQEPTCEVVKCQAVPQSEGSLMNCSHHDTELKYKSTCDFACAKGYTLRGSPQIQCSSDGHWSQPIPVCEAVHCSELQPPVNGSMSCSGPSGNSAGNSTCKFACEEGFKLNGSSELQCDVSGHWDALEPECEAVKCVAVQPPEMGIAKHSSDDTNPIFKSVYEFTCLEGYMLKGSSRIHCSSNGEWSGPVPKCEVVECYAPQKPMHGLFNCSNPSGNYAWNSSCNFSCEEGFVLKGPNMFQCGASGKWDGQEPTCEVVKCQAVPQSEGSLMNCSHHDTELKYKSTCDFACAKGYTLRGSPQIQCSSDGHWSQPIPVCEAFPALGKFLAIGIPVTGLSILSVILFIIWVQKNLQKKRKSFTLTSSFSSLDSEGSFQAQII